MQIICATSLDVETYSTLNAHLQMKRPQCCPHCKTPRSLWSLGIYCRYITVEASGKLHPIKVRRFRCFQCRRTVSLLPSFAQPYRLVCNFTIEKYFHGERQLADVVRNHTLLQRYKRRFNVWFPELINIVGNTIGLSPPRIEERGCWQIIASAFRTLHQATRKLVAQYQVTIFGKYRCHSPCPFSAFSK